MPVLSRRVRVAVALVLVAAVVAARPSGAVAADEPVPPRYVFPIVGRVSYTDTFGACRDGCARRHAGTDIFAPKLTPLVAATDGWVTSVKTTATPDGTAGNYVMLRGDDGWAYWYIHVNNDSPGTDDGANPPQWIFGPGIAKGVRVRAGQLVGYVGDSGNAESTPSHLHFEVHAPDGTVVNPYPSLRAALVLATVDPLDPQADAFVEALYLDFLGWQPSGWERAGTTDALRRRPHRDVVSTFVASESWMGAVIDRFYRDTLGRVADAAGRTFWVGALRDGRTPAEIAAEFYGSDEYHRRSGGADAAWVTALYTALLDRSPDPAGLGYWVEVASAVPRHEVAAAFYASDESRRERVENLYRTLLGRGPDPAGHTYWADQIASGGDLMLAVELASSAEYQARASA